MAAGINSRDVDLAQVLTSMLDRLAKLERPQSFHLGPVGGMLSASQGYTVSIDVATGNLIATSDAGTVTILATP